MPRQRETENQRDGKQPPVRLRVDGKHSVCGVHGRSRYRERFPSTHTTTIKPTTTDERTYKNAPTDGQKRVRKNTVSAAARPSTN